MKEVSHESKTRQVPTRESANLIQDQGAYESVPRSVPLTRRAGAYCTRSSPIPIYHGKQREILTRREIIKRKTLKERKQQNLKSGRKNNYIVNTRITHKQVSQRL